MSNEGEHRAPIRPTTDNKPFQLRAITRASRSQHLIRRIILSKKKPAIPAPLFNTDSNNNIYQLSSGSQPQLIHLTTSTTPPQHISTPPFAPNASMVSTSSFTSPTPTTASFTTPMVSPTSSFTSSYASPTPTTSFTTPMVSSTTSFTSPTSITTSFTTPIVSSTSSFTSPTSITTSFTTPIVSSSSSFTSSYASPTSTTSFTTPMVTSSSSFTSPTPTTSFTTPMMSSSSSFTSSYASPTSTTASFTTPMVTSSSSFTSSYASPTPTTSFTTPMVSPTSSFTSPITSTPLFAPVSQPPRFTSTSIPPFAPLAPIMSTSPCAPTQPIIPTSTLDHATAIDYSLQSQINCISRDLEFKFLWDNDLFNEFMSNHHLCKAGCAREYQREMQTSNLDAGLEYDCEKCYNSAPISVCCIECHHITPYQDSMHQDSLFRQVVDSKHKLRSLNQHVVTYIWHLYAKAARESDQSSIPDFSDFMNMIFNCNINTKYYSMHIKNHNSLMSKAIDRLESKRKGLPEQLLNALAQFPYDIPITAVIDKIKSTMGVGYSKARRLMRNTGIKVEGSERINWKQILTSLSQCEKRVLFYLILLRHLIKSSIIAYYDESWMQKGMNNTKKILTLNGEPLGRDFKQLGDETGQRFALAHAIYDVDGLNNATDLVERATQVNMGSIWTHITGIIFKASNKTVQHSKKVLLESTMSASPVELQVEIGGCRVEECTRTSLLGDIIHNLLCDISAFGEISDYTTVMTMMGQTYAAINAYGHGSVGLRNRGVVWYLVNYLLWDQHGENEASADFVKYTEQFQHEDVEFNTRFLKLFDPKQIALPIILNATYLPHNSPCVRLVPISGTTQLDYLLQKNFQHFDDVYDLCNQIVSNMSCNVVLRELKLVLVDENPDIPCYSTNDVEYKCSQHSTESNCDTIFVFTQPLPWKPHAMPQVWIAQARDETGTFSALLDVNQLLFVHSNVKPLDGAYISHRFCCITNKLMFVAAKCEKDVVHDGVLVFNRDNSGVTPRCKYNVSPFLPKLNPFPHNDIVPTPPTPDPSSIIEPIVGDNAPKRERNMVKYFTNTDRKPPPPIYSTKIANAANTAILKHIIDPLNNKIKGELANTKHNIEEFIHVCSGVSTFKADKDGTPVHVTPGTSSDHHSQHDTKSNMDILHKVYVEACMQCYFHGRSSFILILDRATYHTRYAMNDPRMTIINDTVPTTTTSTTTTTTTTTTANTTSIILEGPDAGDDDDDDDLFSTTEAESLDEHDDDSNDVHGVNDYDTDDDDIFSSDGGETACQFILDTSPPLARWNAVANGRRTRSNPLPQFNDGHINVTKKRSVPMYLEESDEESLHVKTAPSNKDNTKKCSGSNHINNSLKSKKCRPIPPSLQKDHPRQNVKDYMVYSENSVPDNHLWDVHSFLSFVSNSYRRGYKLRIESGYAPKDVLLLHLKHNLTMTTLNELVQSSGSLNASLIAKVSSLTSLNELDKLKVADLQDLVREMEKPFKQRFILDELILHIRQKIGAILSVEGIVADVPTLEYLLTPPKHSAFNTPIERHWSYVKGDFESTKLSGPTSISYLASLTNIITYRAKPNNNNFPYTYQLIENTIRNDLKHGRINDSLKHQVEKALDTPICTTREFFD